MRDFLSVKLSGCPRTLRVFSVPGPGPGITDTIDKTTFSLLIKIIIIIKLEDLNLHTERSALRVLWYIVGVLVISAYFEGEREMKMSLIFEYFYIEKYIIN